MGLTKTGEKLEKYFGRLEDGKATKITPAHVEKIIAKLRAKQSLLHQEISAAKKPSQKERLQRKLTVAEHQINQAEWLLDKIGSTQGAR